ncbi:alpha/beta hydrolase [Corynebacterium alimapuense]|uniref:DUF1023 domain-containing protein n=1 Tax=Corynebacterium alimapuense TaxID=1576874 RepID=A0A3M8K9X4_9CORY|nr:alpha/beta hydrolase [Corynebacterium alimapuense]RNE49946.1 hypothetical protein C5L39_00795 [Corynebacterium alimapuense]
MPGASALDGLDATSLRAAAVVLNDGAIDLWHQQLWLGQSWDELADSGFSGTGAEAAVEHLHLLTEPLGIPPEHMERVSHIFTIAAELQENLDFSAAQAVAIADRFIEVTPLVTLLLRDLQGLGRLLDWTCAREIDLLCTPASQNPLRRLGDVDTLSVEAINQLNLLDADPSITQLAADNPDLYLLETAKGQLVAAVGNPDTADSVVTVVAGVGSSDPSSWPTQIDRVRTVAAATGGAAVLWLGYQAPAQLPQAISSHAARQAGQDLRVFQQQLAQRQPDQRRILVGYSYGSVVAGAAAAGGTGLSTDDLVLVGSPGVGVDHASQLRLNGTNPQVSAVVNPGDPIALAATKMGGVHGIDPASPGFGARVWSGNPQGDHSSYWEDPLFLEQLAKLSERGR